MRTKISAALALFVFGLALNLPLGAQPGEYKKVYSGDILPGYVPEGQLVETDGYLWVTSTGVLLNVDPISARWPLFVDVAGVPPDMLAKVKAACTSERPSLTAGCRAVVRGRVGKRRVGNRDLPGIFATFIVPQP